MRLECSNGDVFCIEKRSNSFVGYCDFISRRVFVLVFVGLCITTVLVGD